MMSCKSHSRRIHVLAVPHPAPDPAVVAAKAASGGLPVSSAAATAANEGVIRQLREHGQKTTVRAFLHLCNPISVRANRVS
jgi:hypothetical protein